MIHCRPNSTSAKELPEEGDLVILHVGHSNLQPVYLEKGGTFQNKHGRFSHDDLLQTKFGTKIFSKDKGGFVMALRPTAELWTNALKHRTQIIYNTDISTIILRLEIKPGSIVAEAGTGSGSLTTSFARTVAPTGHVYTFDFHQQRVEKAAEEFKANGLDHVISSATSDACTEGFPLPDGVYADALMLDLPSPWLSVPFAARALRDRGRVCSFSPCIEQVQKTCLALKEQGFTNISTVEVLVRHWDLHKYQMDVPRFDAFDISEFVACGNHAITKDKRKRKHGEDSDVPGEASEEEPRTSCSTVRPRAVERGHTSFLTFATRGFRHKREETKPNEGEAKEQQENGDAEAMEKP